MRFIQTGEPKSLWFAFGGSRTEDLASGEKRSLAILYGALMDSPRTEACESRGSAFWDDVIEHRERLIRLVRRRFSNIQDAEDCVQEVIVRAASHPGLDRDRLGPFLTSVALRLCVDHYRQVERRSRLARKAAVSPVVEIPEEAICDRDFGRWLLKQAQLLQGREQQVILARADGISTAEFARMHRISLKAAEGAFTRGRARLRVASSKALDGTTLAPPHERNITHG